MTAPVGDPFQAAPDADLVDIDRKVRLMKAVQASWDLPPIPDDVVLDLATQPDMDLDGIRSFLYGLAYDVRQAFSRATRPVTDLFVAPAAAATVGAEPATVPGAGAPHIPVMRALEGTWQWQDLLGIRRSEKPTVDAVSRFKRRAVEMGLWTPPVDANGDPVFDERWSPELGAVRRQMAEADYTRRISGEKFLAKPFDDVVKMIGEWTDPAHLARVAVALDFIPDFKAVGREWRTWGDKWRRWLKNPTSVRDFLDAITGPIDDVAFPLINDALLLSGVGGLYGSLRAVKLGVQTARGVEAATEAGRALYASRNLFDVSRLVEAGRAGRLLARGIEAIDPLRAVARGVEAVADMERPGFLATKLSSSRFGAIRQVGKGLEAWRDLATTKVAKSVFREIGRRGIIGQVEATLFPHSDIFRNASSNQEALDRFKGYVDWGGPLGRAADMLSWVYTPPAYFARGAIASKMAWLSNLRSKMAQASFEAARSEAFWTGIARSIEGLPRRAEFFEISRTKGPRAALLHYFGGDEEELGRIYTWALLTAGIDQRAMALAGKDPIVKFKVARSRLFPLLRQVDPNDLDEILRMIDGGAIDDVVLNSSNYDEILSYAVNRPRPTRKAKRPSTEWRKALTSKDPAVREKAWTEIRRLVQHHNELASGLVEHIVSSVTPASLEWWMRAHYREGQGPHSWTLASDILQDLKAYERKILRGPKTIAENVLSGPAVSEEPVQRVRDTLDKIFDDFRSPHGPIDVDEKVSSWLSSIVGKTDLDMRRLSIARSDTVTKVDAIYVDTVYRTIMKEREILHQALIKDRIPAAVARAFQGKRIPKDEQTAVASVISLLADQSIGGKVKLSSARKQLVDKVGRAVLERIAQIDQFLKEGNEQPFWTNWFGITHSQHRTLGEKLAALRAIMPGLATELDHARLKTAFAGTPVAEKIEQLEQLGYKLVMGVDFLQPYEVNLAVTPLHEMSKLQRYKRALGVGFTRFSNRELNMEQRMRLRGLLAQEAPRLVDPVLLRDRGHYGVADDVMAALYQYIREAQDAADFGDEAGTKLQRFIGRARTATMPTSLAALSSRDIEHALKSTLIDVTPETVQRVRRAVRQSYAIGAQKLGLSQLDALMRTWDPVILPSLHVLGRLRHNWKQAAVFGAAMGAAFQGAFTQGSAEERAGAAALGAVLGGGTAALSAAVGTKAEKLIPKVEEFFVTHPMFHWWVNLPDDLALLRDRLRFALNPIFDLQRYTEGALIGQMISGVELPEGKSLPVDLSLRKLRKQYGDKAADEAMQLLVRARKGDFDETAAALDYLDKAFTERGIMGFSPTHYEAATLWRLVNEHDMPLKDAYDLTLRIFQYGMYGRSAAERSVNFVFFPFSYQKKLYGALFRFLQDDVGRAVFLHDLLKMYDTLNRDGQLSEFWRDHVPVLRALQRFNAFAYGVSPGMFGGINRPFLNVASVAADRVPIVNLFVPQFVSVNNGDHARKLLDIVKGIAPLVNDTPHLLEDAMAQLEIMDPRAPSHVTHDAQVRLAQAEWQKFKGNVEDIAQALGYDGWLSVMQAPSLAPLRRQVEEKRVELLKKYPAWAEVRGAGAEAAVRRADDLAVSLTKKGRKYDALRIFNARFELWRDLLADAGISINDPEEIPDGTIRDLKGLAIELVQQEPDFWPLYRRLFQHLFGPLGVEF